MKGVKVVEVLGEVDVEELHLGHEVVGKPSYLSSWGVPPLILLLVRRVVEGGFGMEGHGSAPISHESEGIEDGLVIDRVSMLLQWFHKIHQLRAYLPPQIIRPALYISPISHIPINIIRNILNKMER